MAISVFSGRRKDGALQPCCHPDLLAQRPGPRADHPLRLRLVRGPPGESETTRNETLLPGVQAGTTFDIRLLEP